MQYTAKQFADLLNGREILKEITKEEEKTAKENGLLVLYGYSDDNIELAGVVSDEFGAYNGTTLYYCPETKTAFNHKRHCDKDVEIKCLWCPKDEDIAWKIQTDIPYEPFYIYEDGETFCKGIVIDTKEIGKENQKDGLIMENNSMSGEKIYDVIIVGGGAGGLFAAYEFTEKYPDKKVIILEKGSSLAKRKCPIDGDKIKNCIHCKVCSITTGIGGAGAFSDGKYNITNDFGGNLHEYVGRKKATELMEYVDDINMKMGGEGTKIYPCASSELKREALKYDLHIMDANVRHLGTEKNYFIIQNIVNVISKSVDIYTDTTVDDVYNENGLWVAKTDKKSFQAKNMIIATGRSGSKWTARICEKYGLSSSNNRVDIGVRFECPAEIWKPITENVYEGKILYRSPKTGCTCRTFCMNPYGNVVAENTNGIVTVNGHSYEDKRLHTNNTNFALLVTHDFTEPFKDSNAYGEHVAALINMLAGGVMVQRFGDLLENKRTNTERLKKSFTRPTLTATPGNLALGLPKQTLDTIIETIFALDKLVPGTANYDNLLYGAEVKFYNSVVDVNNNFESKEKGLYFIGDCSGTTHSLSQASAEGVYVANIIGKK